MAPILDHIWSTSYILDFNEGAEICTQLSYVRTSIIVCYCYFLRTKLLVDLPNFYCRFGTYYPYLGIKVRWYTENASAGDRGRPTSKQFLAHFHRRTNLEPCLRKWIDPSSYAKTDFESWCVTLKDDQFFIFWIRYQASPDSCLLAAFEIGTLSLTQYRILIFNFQFLFFHGLAVWNS